MLIRVVRCIDRSLAGKLSAHYSRLSHESRLSALERKYYAAEGPWLLQLPVLYAIQQDQEVGLRPVDMSGIVLRLLVSLQSIRFCRVWEGAPSRIDMLMIPYYDEGSKEALRSVSVVLFCIMLIFCSWPAVWKTLCRHLIIGCRSFLPVYGRWRWSQGIEMYLLLDIKQARQWSQARVYPGGAISIQKSHIDFLVMTDSTEY